MLVAKMQPLERFIGDFCAEKATLTYQGESQELELDLQSEEVLDGYGIKSSLRGEAVGIGRMDEIDLWGYDAGDDKYHVFTVDNQGTVHDHVGEFTNENSICVRWEGTIDGKPAREEACLRSIDADTIILEDREFVGEEELMCLEGTFKRQKKIK